MKKLTSVIAMMLILSFGFAVPVSAAGTNSYVALGDSISFGYNMTPTTDSSGRNIGVGYPTLFYDTLGSDTFGTYANLSNPGETSTTILQTISDNSSCVSSATIITLSVGSNNILGPVITSIVKAFAAKNIILDPNDPNFETLLQNAIYNNPEVLPELFTKLNNPSDPLTIKLKTNLTLGALKFNKDFPNIIKSIRSKNRTCELYVNTIYNPLKYSDPMYQSLNTLINSMNATIKFYAYLYNYKVVDVYQVIKNNPGYVPFNISTSDISKLNFDVHPTAEGQQAICDKLVTVRDNTWSYYWQKPIWALNY